MHLEVHVRHAPRVPTRHDGDEFALPVFVSDLVAAAVRQALFGVVSRVVAIAVAVPNVDAHARHGLAVTRSYDANLLAHLHPDPVLADVLAEKVFIGRQIQRKGARSLAGHQDAIAPATRRRLGVESRHKRQQREATEGFEEMSAFHADKVAPTCALWCGRAATFGTPNRSRGCHPPRPSRISPR